MDSIYFLHVMNLHHLELFHAVATHGSLTQAAQETFTSQSSVSKQLKVFEDALGMQLVDRLPRGIRLTQAGEILLGHAQAIFAQRDRALQELQELAGLRRGRLALASSRTIGAYLLPEALASFMASHPAIEVKVEVANTSHCLELVRSGALEVALVEGPAEGEDLEIVPFREDELLFVASRNHPLSRKGTAVPLRRVLAEPLIAREPGSGTRAILDRELLRQDVPWKPRLELESTEAIKAFVESGLGVAVLSRLAVARELESGSLVRLRVPLRLERQLSLVRLRSRKASQACEALLKHL